MVVARSVLTWLLMLVFTAICLAWLAPLVLLSAGRLRPVLLAWLQPAWGGLAAALAGVEVEGADRHHLEGSRPRVLVINHSSTLDLVAVAALAAPKPCPVLKREVLWMPPMNLVFLLIGSVFLDRGKESAVASMQRAAEVVRRDHRTVLVSPEGTRSSDGRLGAFKKGPFHLAHQASAELVPVVVRGAHELCPKGSWTVRPGRLRVEVKPPRQPSGDAAADAEALRIDYVRWLGA